MRFHEKGRRVEQLLQIAKSPIWDGNLISKTDRDILAKENYIFCEKGFNCIAPRGIEVLNILGFIEVNQ